MEAALSFASASCGTRTVDPHWPIHVMRTTGGHKTHAFGPQVSCAADMVALSRFQWRVFQGTALSGHIFLGKVRKWEECILC